MMLVQLTELKVRTEGTSYGSWSITLIVFNLFWYKRKIFVENKQIFLIYFLAFRRKINITVFKIFEYD